MRALLAFGVLMVLTGTLYAKEPSVATLPPVVIETVPRAGDKAVDAATTREVRVTFSKDMLDGGWSFVQLSPESFPELVGAPRYLDDGRTCVVQVKLVPGKPYAIWLNTDRFKGFRDRANTPAVPYLLVFETKPE